MTKRQILRPPLVAVVIFGVEVKALYVDEAGCLGALPSATSDIQPVFVIAGVCFDISHLPDITRDFIALKRRFFPGSHTSSHQLDTILVEVKGADIRRNVSSGGRNSQRAAFGFLDKVLDLIEQYQGQAFGRIWVKGIGAQFKAREIYSSSIQSICTTFQASLHATGEPGSDYKQKIGEFNPGRSSSYGGAACPDPDLKRIHAHVVVETTIIVGPHVSSALIRVLPDVRFR